MSEPFKAKKKARPARPETKKHGDIAEEGHSWAVSYADFLMVLLSFFIIFFSLEKGERGKMIDNLLAERNLSKTQNDKASIASAGREVAGQLDKPGKLSDALINLTKTLSGFYVEQKESDRVVISFADNIYNLGAFELPKEHQQTLQELLKKLEPHMQTINITFIGHTDDNSNFKTGNRYVGNNFDLSSLRATKALQNAVKFGFNPRHMYAQGVAENERSTRTLSLVLSPGKGAQ